MKFGFVDEHRAVWPVRVMCSVLGLSASGYYAWRARPESQRAAANRALLDDIRPIHAESSGTYGSPRVHAVLRGHGRRVGRSRIEQLMRHAGLRGLAALPRRARTTDSRHGYPIAPNRLARNFQAQAPNQVWLADLTYIPTGEGWLYLAAILDMHTRKIVGWCMRETLHAQIARRRSLSPSPCRIRDYTVHEPQGRLLGQRPDGEFLPYPQNRAGPPSGLRHTRPGAAGSVRLHRGLLQSPSPALSPRLHQPGRHGAQSGLTPSTSSGEDHQRFALATTTVGLKHAFVNQAVEVAPVRQKLATEIGLSGIPTLSSALVTVLRCPDPCVDRLGTSLSEKMVKGAGE